MKNIINYLFVIVLSLTYSCSNDENQVVPEFLDGTEYGILLDVDITSITEVAIAGLDNYTLTFDVSYKGDKRPVKSITVNKTYIDSENNKSILVEEESITQFPSTISLTSSELANGFSGLSLDDLTAGDSFSISFIIYYEDGKVVDKFDIGLRTNFTVSIVN